MKTLIASLVAAAGMSSAANAVVNTSLVYQVSLDNQTWSSDVDVSNTGSTLVYSRTLVSYTGTASPVGLASLIFQPTVSNWNVTDSLSAFVNGGQGNNTTNPVGVVTNVNDPTQFGRVSPWGRTNLPVANALTGFVQTGPGTVDNPVPAGTWLRIAQATASSWIGGTGNTSGGAGLPIAQFSTVGRTTAEPAFDTSLSDITVFKMGLTINGSADGGVLRDLDIDAPAAGFGNLNTTTGDREVYWWASLTEFTGSIRGTATVEPAHIHVVPAPGALALLGLGGMVAGRRRR